MDFLSWIKSIQFLKWPIAKVVALFNLKTVNTSLKSEVDILKQKLEKSEERKLELEKQIIEIHYNPLVYDTNTGIWFGTCDGLYYCAKCKAKNISSPLKNEPDGWSCPACNKYYLT